ncbi:MAG TPA: transposase [Negativicutes bacterium]
MARKLRIHYPGAVNHVIVRGNNREAVFREEEDKAKYLFFVAKYQQKYQFNLYAYVIMDNHAHLLVAVENEPLAKIMQGIQQSYTQYYNRKYTRVGHVFEQRYKAKVCKQDAYLLSLLRYIHQNPVKARIREGLDYRWSSHGAYQSGRNEFVKTDFVLSLFAQHKTAAIRAYISYIEEETSDKQDIQIEQAYLEDAESTNEQCIPGVAAYSLEEILILVEKATGVGTERILREKYNRQVAQARDMVIYTAIRLGIMSKTELSTRLPVSLVSVIKSYNKVAGEEKLKQQVERMLIV